MGGAEYLVSNLDVDRVWLPEIEYDSYGYNTLMDVLDSTQIEKTALFTGSIDSSLKPLYLRVMAPKRYELDTQPANVNNASIVLQLFYGASTLMLTGDAEAEVESQQIAFRDLLKSDILKAPHHGSKTSSTSEYLKYTKPIATLISLAENNKFKHPAPITLKKYESLGTMIHRTDQEGAIVYRTNGVNWTRVEWRTNI